MKRVLKKVLASATVLSMMGACSSAMAVGPESLSLQYSFGEQAKNSLNKGKRRADVSEDELPKKKLIRDTEELTKPLGHIISSKKYYSCKYSELPNKDGKGNNLTYSFAQGSDMDSGEVIVIVMVTVWKESVPSTPQIIGVLQNDTVHFTIGGLRIFYGMK